MNDATKVVLPEIPDFVYEIFFPAFGLIVCTTAFVYLYLMRQTSRTGIFVAIYTIHAIDFLYGISLFCSGFYGISISVYGDTASAIRPFNCFFRAFHNHIWCIVDSMNLLLLLLLAIDQLISVIWTKRHSDISKLYFNCVIICGMLIISGLTLTYSAFYAWNLSDNSTVIIQPTCHFNEVVGDLFYTVELSARRIVPIIAVFIVFSVAFIIFFLQISQKWQFKWSDNNKDSTKFYYLTLFRCMFIGLSTILPLLFYKSAAHTSVVQFLFTERINHYTPIREVIMRILQSLFTGVAQPIANTLLVPQFFERILKFFNAIDAQRNWQSADDPPGEGGSVHHGDNSREGSWISTTGNIVGEAGIPIELNAHEQRSISFFYNNNPNL